MAYPTRAQASEAHLHLALVNGRASSPVPADHSSTGFGLRRAQSPSSDALLPLRWPILHDLSNVVPARLVYHLGPKSAGQGFLLPVSRTCVCGRDLCMRSKCSILGEGMRSLVAPPQRLYNPDHLSHSTRTHAMAPILDEHALEFISHSPEQTRRLGAHMGALLQGGDTDLPGRRAGIRKDLLLPGHRTGMGGDAASHQPFVRLHPGIPTDQPSLTTLFHVDRLSDLDEAYGLGLDEFLGDRQRSR